MKQSVEKERKVSTRGQKKQLVYSPDYKVEPISGFDLTDKQRQYMLPHFSMIVVGKPGSGKTTLLQNFINDNKFYRDMFNKVYIISPSISKIDVDIPQEQKMNVFDLEVIFEKILECNQEQERFITDIIRDKVAQEKINKQLLYNQTHKDVSMNEMYQNAKTYQTTPGMAQQIVTNKFSLNSTPQMSRFVDAKFINNGIGRLKKRDQKEFDKRKSKKEEQFLMNKRVNEIVDFADSTHKLFRETLTTREQMYNTHKHILFVLDDVVADIKANEHNPALTKLFFNRRNIVANGTISIMVVTQKFTSLPQKIRSNSNWLILFRLNPVEFEAVWKDAVILSRDNWSKMLGEVFGTEEDDIALSNLPMDEQVKKRKYDNLGIWVEFSNIMFKNFERISITPAEGDDKDEQSKRRFKS